MIQVQESLIACAKQQSQQLKFCRELASAVAQKASSLAGKDDYQTPVSAQQHPLLLFLTVLLHMSAEILCIGVASSKITQSEVKPKQHVTCSHAFSHANRPLPFLVTYWFFFIVTGYWPLSGERESGSVFCRIALWDYFVERPFLCNFISANERSVTVRIKAP